MRDAFAERMDDFPIGVDVADVQAVFHEREPGKAVDLPNNRSLANFVMRVKGRTAAAGDDEGGFESFEFECWRS